MTTSNYTQAESVELQIGNIKFDAIRIVETGEYRMSQKQILNAIDADRTWFSTLGKKNGLSLKVLQDMGLGTLGKPIKVEYNSNKNITRSESRSLDDADICWEYFSEIGNQQAKLILRALRRDSLRDRFDQAYDKPRISKEDRQLLDLMILAQPEKRGIHFEEEWRKEAERVTKYKWKTMPMAKFIRKAIYDWRFPAKVMVRVSEVNPYVNANRRQNKHYQHFEENIDTNVLQKHIHDVFNILKVSTSQSSFWNNMSSRFGEAIQQELI
jgi:hypothetical protein